MLFAAIRKHMHFCLGLNYWCSLGEHLYPLGKHRWVHGEWERRAFSILQQTLGKQITIDQGSPKISCHVYSIIASKVSCVLHYRSSLMGPFIACFLLQYHELVLITPSAAPEPVTICKREEPSFSSFSYPITCQGVHSYSSCGGCSAESTCFSLLPSTHAFSRQVIITMWRLLQALHSLPDAVSAPVGKLG